MKLWWSVNAQMAFIHMCCIFCFWVTVSGYPDLSIGLPPHDIIQFPRKIVKRHSDAYVPPFENIEFNALGTTYRARIWSVRSPIHSNFQLLVGDDRQDAPELEQMYEGHLLGNSSHKVLLTRIPSGGYIGTISTLDDVIYLEIAQHSGDDRDIMVYKASDVDRMARVNLANDINHSPNVQGVSRNKRLDVENQFRVWRRQKKEVPMLVDERRNRCPMKIVADYKFFTAVGKMNIALTTRYIINMIANVNEIYRRVNWDEGQEDSVRDRGRFHGLGFSIKELKILDTPSVVAGHYNGNSTEPGGHWKSGNLLQAFTLAEGTSRYCMVHLLTAQTFSDSSDVGVAYVAIPRQPYTGVCAESTLVNGKSVVYNTLFTTNVGHSSKKEYPLVTREVEIVVAHEYGHGWGASHDHETVDIDIDNEECLPSYKDGGKFIMNRYAQMGYDYNNNRFSRCSIHSIRTVLERRWKLCFVEEQSSYCGNGVVEEGEECDEGGLLSSGHIGAPCCSRNCTLIAAAVCSPRNQPCCSESCSYMNASHMCLHSSPWHCKGESFCTGISGECPAAPPVPDGETCVEEGECLGGKCVPYCERRDIGKKSCICQKVELSCRRCCRSLNGTGLCEPQENATDLRDGTWCVQGHCKKSKCVDSNSDYMAYYLDVFQGSKFWPFIQSNIVGIVVLLSICIWCPCSYFISKKDRAQLDETVKANKMRRIAVPREDADGSQYTNEGFRVESLL